MKSSIHRVNRLLQTRAKRNEFGRVFEKYCDFTMIDKPLYVDNLLVAERTKGLAGDVVECGVWRGGMSAGLAEVLGPDRMYYLFDSFEGLPPAQEIDGAVAQRWQADTASPAYFDNCRAEMEFAREAMTRASVRFECIKGWFEDTIPQFRGTDSISLLRLDGDWYDSTMVCLEHFFPRVVDHGIVLIDDYHTWTGCSRAVHDYLAATRSASRIHQSPAGVAYIVKRTED